MLVKMDNYSTITISACIVVLITYFIYNLVNWVWVKPKRLERCLRQQGFSGNPYRWLMGDQESPVLIKQALSKPISFNDDIKERVIPHIMQTIKNHGVNSFMWLGRIPRVHITEPELIKEALLKYTKFHRNLQAYQPITRLFFQTAVATLEGDSWYQRRRMLNPFFHFEKLKLMVPAFYLSCIDMVTKWENKALKTGSVEVDVHHDFETVTGDMIARTFFGYKFEECGNVFDLLKELQVLTIEVIQSSVYIPGWRFMPTKRNQQMRKVNKQIIDSVMEIIDRKKKALKEGKVNSSSDFLSKLLEMNSSENKSNQISIKDIIAECRLFYFAGQDTTSTLLSWTMLLLSRYQDWQTRARDEILHVIENGEPDFDKIPRLKIVTMILYEVLRLYPPAVEITKVTAEETKLGDLLIPAGVQLMLPTIILHHDREIWGDDVNEFKPERFAEGIVKATKKQGSYIPFGLGPRMCIGQNFSLLEAKVALAVILSRYSFELSPSYIHAPFTLVTLQPQFGVPLILHKL